MTKATITGASLSGYVHSGKQPIINADVQLYAAGESSGTASTPLLNQQVRSDAEGNFTISEYSCPSALSQVYLVARGGAPASQLSSTNGYSILISALGNCDDLASMTSVEASELTTVASISTLAPFMQSVASVEAVASDAQGLHDGFISAGALTSILEAANMKQTLPQGRAGLIPKLISLADITSACTNMTGAAVGDDNLCSTLFSYAKPLQGSTPLNTADALLQIVKNPAHNVIPIFSLIPSIPLYQPALTSAPQDWSVASKSTVPQPVFSPSPGPYIGTQSITLMDGASGAWIFYNVGGTWRQYTGAFTLLSSATIQAIAIAANGISAVATGTYTISPPTLSVAAPSSSAVGQIETGTISINVVAPQGGTIVSVTSSVPAVAAVSPGTITLAQGQSSGSFSYKGLTPGTTILSASATGFAPGSAQTTITPPVSVTITPPSAILAPSMTQLFTAIVSNTTNTAVTWSLNPVFGSLSSTGVYTAPASIVVPQALIVTATSVADATKTASASVSLVPPVSVALFPGAVTLASLQTQQFTPTVTGTTNSAVTWSLSPAVGSISSAGLYTAPSTITSAQTVTVTATSMANTTKIATASVSLAPPVSANATYYLSPTGLDSNNGTSSSTPWLTPNHAVNCGDVIIASASTSYSAANFAGGKWGAVACLAGNNVAWLKCATFDACKISVTSGSLDDMRVSASYWGVQGWEVSNTAGGANGGNCLNAVPASSTNSIHHIIFANNVVDVCPLDGISMGPNGTASVDYWVVVGNVVYSAGVSNTFCGSGISAYEPVATDSLPGTHIYVAGNFSFSNTNPPGCYDGNGIIFDTFDGNQTSMPLSYSQQGVIDNNISLSNGAVGIRIEYNNAGAGPSHSQIFVLHNTMWNNGSGTYQYGNPTCGEMQLYKTEDTAVSYNLAATNQPGCYGDSGNPAYAFSVVDVDGTSSVYQNVGWSATGTNDQLVSSPGFSYGSTNGFGVNPNFTNPVTPSAPNCGAASSVPNCMATVIASFTSTNIAAIGNGYQIPSTGQVSDPLFPQWLCNVHLPPGLVTMGCVTGLSNSRVAMKSGTKAIMQHKK